MGALHVLFVVATATTGKTKLMLRSSDKKYSRWCLGWIQVGWVGECSFMYEQKGFE